VSIVAVDSTEPDLDHGQIGRGRYRWIEEQFAAEPADLRIFVLHHHLLPIPGTGRERNVVYDAGDAIECLQRAGVNLVLSGHKHVPYAWKLENLFVVNTGTVSTLRLRGHTRPCYNVVEVAGTHVAVWRRYPFRAARIAEDLEWALTVLQSGYRLAYVPEAVVVHSHDRSVRYELQRTYAVHQRLQSLLGLSTVPGVLSLARAIAVTLPLHLRLAAGDSRGRGRALARAAGLAVALPLGQYLGARSAREGREFIDVRNV
jgi:predicted phosphodiesterase